MNNKLTWQQHVEKVEAHKALGTREIYLNHGNFSDYPWHLATHCEPGGSHRLDMATSIWFRGKHPSGLEFRWSFDLESRSANGKGHYEINVEGVRQVMILIPKPVQTSFSSYLVDAANKVEANARDYDKVAQIEYGAASILRRLASQTDDQEPNSGKVRPQVKP